MHSLAKKLLMARKLKFGEDGKAELLDHDYMFIDGYLLYCILTKGGELMSYELGKEMGRKMAMDIKKMGLSGTRFIYFMLDLLTMIGLGNFSMEKFDLKTKEGEIRVMNSLTGRFSQMLGRKEKSCQFISGLLSSIFAQEYGQNFKCKEISCMAEGSEMCRFKLKEESS